MRVIGSPSIQLIFQFDISSPFRSPPLPTSSQPDHHRERAQNSDKADHRKLSGPDLPALNRVTPRNVDQKGISILFLLIIAHFVSAPFTVPRLGAFHQIQPRAFPVHSVRITATFSAPNTLSIRWRLRRRSISRRTVRVLSAPPIAPRGRSLTEPQTRFRVRSLCAFRWPPLRRRPLFHHDTASTL